MPVVANAYEKHEQIYPEPGWVEHDPVEIWENTRTVVGRALREAGLDPGQLAGLGITNQRETTLIWDEETGKPIYNALVWQDRRTTDRVEVSRPTGRSSGYARRPAWSVTPTSRRRRPSGCWTTPTRSSSSASGRTTSATAPRPANS